MKAIVQNDYGSPDVLELKEIDKPVVRSDEVLVRVHAAAIHIGDCFCMRGVPYVSRIALGLPRPKDYVPGFDVAGRVDAVGTNVTRFQPGDEVFGACRGTCAEYACAAEDKLAPMPTNLTFEQAAAVPTSAVAALLGLRDAGKVQPGQRVLIDGASGGVGTFAVQIAKALGAEVTGVCSTRNVDIVLSLGADHVIDYQQEDFTRTGKRYDLVLDLVASRGVIACRRALEPGGRYLAVGGPLRTVLNIAITGGLLSLFGRRKVGVLAVNETPEALSSTIEVFAQAGITPVIDKCFPLEHAAEAIAYHGQGKALGKVVVTMD